jgi:hypothetical protein
LLVPRSSNTSVAAWAWLTWVVSQRRVLEVVFILLESPSPSRRIFIGSHSLPPLWFAVSVLQSCPGRAAQSPEHELQRPLPTSAAVRAQRHRLDTNSGHEPSRGDPHTFSRAFPHISSPPLAGISPSPLAVASQGPNCESHIPSRGSSAKQGLICKESKTYRGLGVKPYLQ